MRCRLLILLLLIISTSIATGAEEGSGSAGSPNGAVATSENTDKALKIAGLVAFVANSCQDLIPDYEVFKIVISSLGFETSDLSKSDLRVKYLNYTGIYQKDITGNCTKAWAMFGDEGTMFKGLFHHK